jgi:hypothetical protein
MEDHEFCCDCCGEFYEIEEMFDLKLEDVDKEEVSVCVTCMESL